MKFSKNLIVVATLVAVTSANVHPSQPAPKSYYQMAQEAASGAYNTATGMASNLLGQAQAIGQSAYTAARDSVMTAVQKNYENGTKAVNDLAKEAYDAVMKAGKEAGNNAYNAALAEFSKGGVEGEDITARATRVFNAAIASAAADAQKAYNATYTRGIKGVEDLFAKGKAEALNAAENAKKAAIAKVESQMKK